MNEEQRAILQEIYSGAEEAGLRIAGISQIAIEENQSAPGDRFTLTVRVGESGRLLPRAGDSDEPASSLLRLQVYQHTLVDSHGDGQYMWKSYARQVDVGKGRVFRASASGPTAEQVSQEQAGRPAHEYLDDNSFIDETLAQSAATPAEAVRQALLSLVDRSGGLLAGGEADHWDPGDAASSHTPAEDYLRDATGGRVWNYSDSSDAMGETAELEVTDDMVLRNDIEARDSGLDHEDFVSVEEAGGPDDDSTVEPSTPAADDNGASRWVKWGVPAVVAAALIIAGSLLFGNGTDGGAMAGSQPAEVAVTTLPESSEDEHTRQSDDAMESERSEGDTGTEQQDQEPEEPADAEPETAGVNLVEIGAIGLFAGQATSYTTTSSFDAFFHTLFVPEDAIATVSALNAAEDYVEQAKTALTTDRTLEVVGEVEVTQFHGDPATDPPSQPSVGAVVRISPVLFDVAAIGSDGSTYTEVNVFRLFFCEPYPDCDGSHIVGVNLGGPLEVDTEQAIIDALLILEEGPAGVADGYGWGFQITGDMSEVAD